MSVWHECNNQSVNHPVSSQWVIPSNYVWHDSGWKSLRTSRFRRRRSCCSLDWGTMAMKAVPDKPGCCIWDCKSHEVETWYSVFMSPVCETSPCCLAGSGRSSSKFKGQQMDGCKLASESWLKFEPVVTHFVIVRNNNFVESGVDTYYVRCSHAYSF